MSGDEGSTVVAADGAYLMMDDILERLKMLDYEAQFKRFKPLSHTYFAMASSNPNEQFFYFMSLCSWLMGLLGTEWQTPSQMDDPNSSASSLYAKLQEVGAPTHFGGWQKLKAGFGEPCCLILKWLLEQIPIEFKPALHTEEAEYEEAAVDEEAVDDTANMADEVGDAENEEEEYYHGGGGEGAAAAGRGKLTDSILDSQVEPEAWRIELERVTPQLKMQVLSDPKEWRNRLVNTKSHQTTLVALTPETSVTLERLAEELERTLGALKKAESKLNTQCADAVSEYADKQDELQKRMDEYNNNSDTINALTNELHSVSEDLSQVKERMDTRGASMTDTSPLVKIKSALSKLRTETKQLEIRIGVLTHTLVAKKVKEASSSREKAASKIGKALDGGEYFDDDDDTLDDI